MKTPFWNCVWYLILISVLSFPLGRILPKKWFRADAVPYRSYSFEAGGRIYEKFGIRKWQNKVPDMSKLFPKWMPPKGMAGNYKGRLEVMIQETCIAEIVHTTLCVLGLYCIRLWPGVGGLLLALIYALALNLPFVIIQRYNRPRLQRLKDKLQRSAEPCVP